MSNIQVVESVETSKAFLWSLLACVGGITRFLATEINATHKKFTPKSFFTMLIANAFISGFTGLMGALVISRLTSDQTLHLVSAGVFGYLGPQGMELVVKYLQNRIPIQK